MLRLSAAIALLGTSLAGIGWIGTQQFRAERAEPGLAERAAEVAEAAKTKTLDVADSTANAAGAAAKASVETGKSWIDRAKDWID